MATTKKWINFDELRKQLNFREVLASYKVTLEPKGTNGQFVGTCPLPSHRDAKGKTFSANFEKGIFQCFHCKAGGNIIDFAVFMEGKDKSNGKDVRAVAEMLREKFVRDAAPDYPRDRPRAPREKLGEQESLRKTVVNEPLNFELKTLDAKHPWFAAQKFSNETVDRFGLGYCKRGTLAGRIAVPLVDDGAELVGYAGLILDEAEVPDGCPRYLFPPPREHDGALFVLEPGRFLYNGFRIGKSVKDIIVVREPHSVWRLWQGGFANVVALMGDTCSDEQAAMIPLLTSDTARIWFLTDSSSESEGCAGTFFPRVAASRLCRWVKVAKDEEIAPEHPLLAALPKR